MIWFFGNKNDSNVDDNGVPREPLTATELAKKFKVSFKTAKRWKDCKTEFQTQRKKRTVKKPYKFNKKIKSFIIKEAGNKLTSIQFVSSKDMTEKINENFGIGLSQTTVRRYLKKVLSRAYKIKRSFTLTEENMRERYEFCKTLIENKIKGKDIFFTDEKKFYLQKPMNRGTNYVRLTKEFQKLKDKGDPKVLKLLSDDQPKYSKSFMVAGGLSAYGLGKLVFCAGNQDQKAYIKTLDYFKEDIRFFHQKYDAKLLLQQDNAPCHVGGLSEKKIKNIFFSPIQAQELKWPGDIPKKKYHTGYTTKQFKDLKSEIKLQQDLYREKKEYLECAWVNANFNQNLMALNWPSNSPVLYKF